MKFDARTILWWVGGLLLAGAIAAWLVSATEWATRDVWEPPQGEAARDPHFLFKRLATKLGAHVEVRHQLDQLPPDGATLLLEDVNWRFIPEREAALRAWVERGGHLVAYRLVADNRAVTDWVPATFGPSNPRAKAAEAASSPDAAASAASDPSTPMEDDDETEYDEDEEAYEDDEEEPEPSPAPTAAAPASGPSSAPSTKRRETPCPPLAEPAQHPGWFGAPRSFDTCARGEPIMKTRAQPIWSVADDKGLRVLRLPVGQGSATLSTQWSAPKFSTLQDDDEALLMAAIVQLHPGQLVWIIDDTHHPGLFATLWRIAPAACMLFVLALALVLWRWSVRFAPLRAPDTLARRSIAEQVRGTAAYLLRHGPAALHRAQLRALDEAAQGHVTGWRRLPAEQRAALLARYADLPPAELEKACNPSVTADPGAAGRALGLIEAARRRIAELRREAAEKSRTPPPSV
jgi:hypothetical protein